MRSLLCAAALSLMLGACGTADTGLPPPPPKEAPPPGLRYLGTVGRHTHFYKFCDAGRAVYHSGYSDGATFVVPDAAECRSRSGGELEDRG